jgi:hypothetical protein
VVSHLSAPVNANNRDLAVIENVFFLAGQTLRKDRWMLKKPDFILSLRTSLGGKRFHFLESWRVVDHT